MTVAVNPSKVRTLDMKLEIVVLPVSDVERPKGMLLSSTRGYIGAQRVLLTSQLRSLRFSSGPTLSVPPAAACASVRTACGRMRLRPSRCRARREKARRSSSA